MLKNSFLFDFIRILQIFIKLFDNDFCSSLLIELAKRFTKPKDNLVNTMLFSTIRGFLIFHYALFKVVETLHSTTAKFQITRFYGIDSKQKTVVKINL